MPVKLFGHTLWPVGLLSFLTRDQIHAACIGSQSLTHWGAREVPSAVPLDCAAPVLSVSCSRPESLSPLILTRPGFHPVTPGVTHAGRSPESQALGSQRHAGWSRGLPTLSLHSGWGTKHQACVFTKIIISFEAFGKQINRMM